MPNPKLNPKKFLQQLSSGSKIGVQTMWVVMLVILPAIFPNIIDLQYKTELAILMPFILVSSIFFEFLTYVWKEREKIQAGY